MFCQNSKLLGVGVLKIMFDKTSLCILLIPIGETSTEKHKKCVKLVMRKTAERGYRLVFVFVKKLSLKIFRSQVLVHHLGGTWLTTYVWRVIVFHLINHPGVKIAA